MNGTCVTNRGHIYTFTGAEFLDRELDPITSGSPDRTPVALTWIQVDSRSREVWRNTVFLKDVERIAILQEEES